MLPFFHLHLVNGIYLPVNVYVNKSLEWLKKDQMDEFNTMFFDFLKLKIKIEENDKISMEENLLEIKSGKYIQFNYQIQKNSSYPILLEKDEKFISKKTTNFKLLIHLEPSTSIVSFMLQKKDI